MCMDGAIAFMLLICMIMFPEMNTDMEGLTDMFSNMGSFTRSFRHGTA